MSHNRDSFILFITTADCLLASGHRAASAKVTGLVSSTPLHMNLLLMLQAKCSYLVPCIVVVPTLEVKIGDSQSSSRAGLVSEVGQVRHWSMAHVHHQSRQREHPVHHSGVSGSMGATVGL